MSAPTLHLETKAETTMRFLFKPRLDDTGKDAVAFEIWLSGPTIPAFMGNTPAILSGQQMKTLAGFINSFLP